MVALAGAACLLLPGCFYSTVAGFERPFVPTPAYVPPPPVAYPVVYPVVATPVYDVPVYAGACAYPGYGHYPRYGRYGGWGYPSVGLDLSYHWSDGWDGHCD